MTNLLVGQSGGPTAAINASLAGVIKEALDGDIKVYGMVNGIEGVLNERIIDMGEYIKGDYDLRLLKQTPSTFLGSCRLRLPEIGDDQGIYEKIFNILHKRHIDYFIYIGGNDSMDTIDKLSRYSEIKGFKIRFIGIPKTIDNDLLYTDHTPGFGSASKYISCVTKETRRDIEAYDIPSCTIIEIMGRNSGWLACSSALSKSNNSKGPDLIYVAENVFDLDKFLKDVYIKIKENTNVLVCISEGLKLEDGRYISEISGKILHGDNFGHLQLTGAGDFLSSYIHDNLGVKTRGIELNSIQRSAGHILSKTDIEEAFNGGRYALSLLKEGLSGKMVTINREDKEEYGIFYSHVDINRVCNMEKKLPENFYDREKAYVTDAFIEYCKPLIQGEVDLVYEDGLPSHLTRNKYE